MRIATAPRKNSKHWRQDDITWGEFVARLRTPAGTKECGQYVLGDLSGPTRTKDTILTRGALTLDADTPSPTLPALYEVLCGWRAVIHTTYSSTPDQPRYRIVIPLAEPISARDYPTAVQYVMDILGRQQFDPGSIQPERYMFWAAASDPDSYVLHEIDGPLATPEELVGRPAQPSLADAPVPRQRKADPTTLDGTVGSFCRAYTVEEAIAAFDLPYDPAPGPDRWTLRGAASVAGLHLIAPGIVFSHHSTDPAYGVACNVWDLVRLHRFADLDRDTPITTPPNRRPSHDAMQELATQDVKVLAEIVGDDFKDPSWRTQLRVGKGNGRIFDEIYNYDLMMQHWAPKLRFNDLTSSIVREDGSEFTSADIVRMRNDIEREFRLRPAKAYFEDIVLDHAHRDSFNPIADYLTSLEWDGVSRVEECLPGVVPTPFTRLAARKSLVAAVARMLEPGVKWDHTLVLYGGEGIGKSYWIHRMAQGYSAKLGSIREKDTLLTLHRSWIMLSDEGYSLRKADADQLKDFITTTDDTYRAPYDKEVRTHKRRCVIWSTTNDPVFLRIQEGNRRYLVVHAEEKYDFDLMTDEYIDQVWAEAVHLYHAGERLYLTDDEAALNRSNAARYTEEDAFGAQIAWAMDQLVPPGWDDMSPDMRRLWYEGRRIGQQAAGTELQTQICTAAIWYEVLQQDWATYKRQDILEIEQALYRVGWERSSRRVEVKWYGHTTVHTRSLPDDDLIWP
jgi:hypothetical protein